MTLKVQDVGGSMQQTPFWFNCCSCSRWKVYKTKQSFGKKYLETCDSPNLERRYLSITNNFCWILSFEVTIIAMLTFALSRWNHL